MANSSLIAPALTGGHGSTRQRRSHVARRRRVVFLMLVALIVAAAVLINYGPMTAYRDAHARLDTAVAQVKDLQKQKDALQSELGKLSEAGYLESLARQQLTYAKPGEEIYIVPAEETAPPTGESASSETQERGWLERILSALGDLF
jgi:cell division protein FtsL